MAKFSGKIGYVTTEETSPGVHREQITERQYYGDLIKHSRKWGSYDGLNDNIIFSQSISIVADPYLYENTHNMRYVIFQGIKWKITDFEINRPRVIISMGDEYYGD